MGILLKKSLLYAEEKQLAREEKQRFGQSSWLFHIVLIPTITIINTSNSFELRITWLCFSLSFYIWKEIWVKQFDERTEEEKKTICGSYNYVPPKIKTIYKKKYHFFKQRSFF